MRSAALPPVMLLLSALLGAQAHAQARPITPPYEGNCQAPVWAPDGSRLAYEVNFHDRRVIELYVYTPGSEPRAVRPLARSTTSSTAGFSTATTDRVAHEVSWSPASLATFAYSASNEARDYELYLDGAGALVAGPGADGGPAWSPDGRWLAFTSARTGQGDLYLLDLQDVTAPPRRITSAPTSAELYAAWAPSGGRLAYVGHRDSGDQIFVIDDIRAPAPRAVAALGHTQTRPRFSPDGQWLAFYSNHRDPKRFDLMVLSTTTPAATPTLLAEGVVLNTRGPAWSPDSRHLIFVRDDDDQLDPVWAAPVTAPASARRIQTGTVSNTDLDVVRGTDGNIWLAVAAQGDSSSRQIRDFRRIYIVPLAALP